MSNRPEVTRNPLGYYCPPNGAGADYILETNFERFIAYGLLRCYDDVQPKYFSLGDKMNADDKLAIRELREAFLVTVEETLLMFWTGEWEVGKTDFDADSIGEACRVNVGEENDELQIMLEWSPFAINEDAIMFDMFCTVLVGEGNGGDPLTLHLGMEAIEDRAKVREVIRKAREINAYPYRTDYQNDKNAELWQKVLNGEATT